MARVLVVDLDNQINATLSLMSPAEFAKRRKETDFEAFGRSGSQTNCSPMTIQRVIQSCVCKIKELDCARRY